MADTQRLPKPFSSEWDWQLQGSCQGLNSSVFFHPDGERGSARTRRADRAKAICQRCPVLDSCRRHALTTREPYGIWGGMTEEERRELWTSPAFSGLNGVKRLSITPLSPLNAYPA